MTNNNEREGGNWIKCILKSLHFHLKGKEIIYSDFNKSKLRIITTKIIIKDI